MVKRITELEAERNQQRAWIEGLITQMATEKFENEACFRRLKALLLHRSSSSSVPEVAQRRAHSKGGNTKFMLFLFFLLLT
jgi:uncharacterized coiled-coil protein SlyX